MERDSRKVIRELENDGWQHIGTTGSHHHFKHPVKPGKITVPHPVRDIPVGTVRQIYKRAGLLAR